MTSYIRNKTWYQTKILPMRNNLTPYRYFVKIKLKSSKRRLSGKVNEIEQKDVKNDVISKKRDILSNKDFAKMVLSLVEQFDSS